MIEDTITHERDEEYEVSKRIDKFTIYNGVCTKSSGPLKKYFFHYNCTTTSNKKTGNLF